MAKGWIPLKRESIMQAIYLNGTQAEKNEQAFIWGSYFAHQGNTGDYLKRAPLKICLN